MKRLITIAPIALSCLLASYGMAQEMAPAPMAAGPKDIVEIRAAAERGDVDAEVELAEAYHDGLGGLPKDDKEAVKWFQKAAEKDDTEAEYNLGIAYYHGIGVEKNLNEAVRWFLKAAQQGYGDAQYIIAAAYQNGTGGLPTDLAQADMWIKLAEAQGNKDAFRDRLELESSMTPEQKAKAELLLKAWKPTPQNLD